MLTLYQWLLRLYPAIYRCAYEEEMAYVFRQAQLDLDGRSLAQRARFYARESRGLLLGALRERLRSIIGAQISFRRFDMRPEFRFPRSTVFLMTVVLAGVVLAIEKATAIELNYGSTLGTVWPALPWFFLFMLLTMSATAAVVWGIMFALRRTGMHRLANMQIRPDQR